LTVPGTGQADDAWIVKLDGQGNSVWQRTYGGGDKDAFRCIEETADGSYLAVGFCSNITTYGKVDFWVVKTTSTGDLVWQRGYGGSDSERAYSFQPLADGGFIILGEGFKTTWIIRISASGEIVWQKKIETLITFDEGGDVADRLFGENSILISRGGITIVTPRKYNDVGGISGFTCTGLAVLDINESGEIVKQRNIIPQANLVGGVTLGKAALHENGFGGYYIVSNPTGEGRPPWASIYVDNMCDGNYVTPDIASSDTDASGEPTHVASMPREFPISELHASPVVVTKTIAYTCGDISLAEYSVSPAKLQFGASLPPGAGISANQTAPQRIIIENKTAVQADWTISFDKPWIAVDKVQGKGGAIITVSASTSGLGAGEYTGTLYVSSPNAKKTPQKVEIRLKVYGYATTSPPFGYFETPVDYSNVTGSIAVSGWVLDDIETTEVGIWRDPVAGEGNSQIFIGDAVFVAGARPDVENIYTGYPFNYRAGWGYMLLTNMLPSQGNGTFKLYAYASDKEGDRLLGVKTITCMNASAIKPFGAIDTPAQGGDASGSAFVNFGWALTPLNKSIPKDGSTITVWVDGVQVGDLKTAPNVYDQYRVDVATAFPGLNNSDGPVGAFYLDTTKYLNGVHIIHWIVADDAGANDGIGSRYFNIVNTGTAEENGAGIQTAGGRIPLSLESMMRLPLSFEPRNMKRGFDLTKEQEILRPDNDGVLQVVAREVERIEIDLGKAKNYFGYLVVGSELRPLPIGSTLDAANGVFSWMPGPGFMDKYDLVFLRPDDFGITERIPVKITIKPKFD